jgi:DNA-binding LytR/AlgR family response regulator
MSYLCIIIDDDKSSLEYLKECIEQIPMLKLLKSYANPLLALAEINNLEYAVDIVFTDVEMPQISGIEVSRRLKDKVKSLILVSAHMKYALDGYSVDAKHFLSKPYSFGKFQSVLNSVLDRLSKDKPRIKVRLGAKGQFINIFIDKIIAIQGASNYIIIHTTEDSIITYYKLSTILEDLTEFKEFKRVSKSFIISTKHIEKIIASTVYLTKNIKVSVGDSYKEYIKHLNGL